MPIPGFNEGFPANDEIVGPDRKATPIFSRYFEQSLQRRVDASPVRTDPVTPVPAAGGSTNLSESGNIGGSQSSGFYQVNAYLETVIEDIGGTPEAELTITFTHNGKSLSRIYPALDGTSVSNCVGVADTIQVDPATTVGYVITRTDGTTPGLFAYMASIALTLIQPIAVEA